MRTQLQKGEKILLITHSSWTSLVGPVLIALAGIAASYFIGFLNHYGWVAAVLGLIIFFARYASWKVNIWVVTSYSVIDEAGLLSHYAKESPLDKINNVSYDQSIAGHLFNFGHVEIQTAAETGATDYYNVNHPKRLKDTITAAQSEYKNLQVTNQAQQMAAAINAHVRAVPASNMPNVALELEKLFELKMKGALSEEEYNRAKARLLDHH
ncbi:MAG TPA: PH domain-containing protein [Puia sp.]|nr:PH domain-containing protein [Puia sp.]